MSVVRSKSHAALGCTTIIGSTCSIQPRQKPIGNGFVAQWPAYVVVLFWTLKLGRCCGGAEVLWLCYLCLVEHDRLSGMMPVGPLPNQVNTC
jgi:hypothetical protein